MATNHTANYGLHVWEPEDDFSREEINENFAALGNALGNLLEMGCYTGDGSASRTIDLGFTPRAVFVAGTNGRLNDSYRSHGGLALSGQPYANYNGVDIVKIVEGGFQVYYSTNESASYPAPQSNMQYRPYNYIALR